MRSVPGMPVLNKRMKKIPPEDVRGEGVKIRYILLGVVLTLSMLTALDIYRTGGSRKTAVLVMLPAAGLVALVWLLGFLRELAKRRKIRRSWASLSPVEKIRIEQDVPEAEALHCLLFTRDAVIARMKEGLRAIPTRDIIWVNCAPNGKKAQIVTRYKDYITLRSQGFRKKWRDEDFRKRLEPFTTAVVYGNKSQRYSILAGEEFFLLIREAEKAGSFKEPRETRSTEEKQLAEAGYEIVNGRLSKVADHKETPLEKALRKEVERREDGEMPALKRRMNKIHSYHPALWSVLLLHVLGAALAYTGPAGIRYMQDNGILTQDWVRPELAWLFLLLPVLFYWLPMIGAWLISAGSLDSFSEEELRRIDRDASRAHSYYYLLFTRDAVLAKLYGSVLAIPLKDIVWVHTTDMRTLKFVTRKHRVYTFRHVGGGKARWLPEYIEAYTASGRHGILFGKGKDNEYNRLYRWHFRQLVAKADAKLGPAATAAASPQNAAQATAATVPAEAAPQAGEMGNVMGNVIKKTEE